ncbi:MAG TPA: hypothetical protein VGM70_06175 [Pseudolysinimonas sp.]
MFKFVASAAAVLVAVSLSLIGVAGSAVAAGSGDAIPYTLTTTSLTLPSGDTFNASGPTSDGNIKYIPLSQYVAGQTYTNQGSNWTVLNINFHIEQNAGFGASMIGTSTLPFDSAASGGAFRGTLPSTGYCIVWAQVDGFNEHFGEGSQTPLCTTPVTTADAAAGAPTKMVATCGTGQTLALGTATNATWGTVTGGTGPSSYSVTATATAGHTFPDGTTTKTFTGSLTGPLSASNPACKTAPVCIPDSSVSYTYLPGSNSGVITVTDIANSTGVLCHPFWVTATAWLYTQDAVWPQVLDTATTQYLPEISAPGSYPYAAQVTCGQGDIYASTMSQPMPTAVLNGPNTPYTEHFLHDMGFTGPTPTYVQQATSCNTVTPVSPSASVITSCGVYGSVSVPASTAAITYTVTGSGNVGDYTITAKVNSPYTLKAGATTSWTFHLGQYAPCVTACTTVTAAPVSTNLDNAGWTFGESKSGGHHEYVASGLHIWTDGSGSSDKSAGYVSTSFPLSQAGTTNLGYANGSGQSAPGLQLSVYVNGAFFGNLVDEPLFTGWWSSHAVTGMPAGPNPSYQLSYGSLNDYLFAWAQQGVTNVQVEAVGYSLGSGAKGDGIVTSITAGCSSYSFSSKTYAPTASYTLGACYPNGTFSSKNLFFHFDNSASDVPVTFTVAGTTISDQVAAHATDTVEGTPIWDLGGSYDVYADGVLLTGLTIPSFTGCLDSHPGDPSVSPEVCTNGFVSNGSITVDLKPSLLYTITGVGNPTNITEVTSTETFLPAGTYKVGVTARPGFVLSGADSWPLTRIVLPPVHCETITPLAATITTELGCTTDGSYTIPQQNGVAWKVNGVDTLPGSYPVAAATTVDVTASPVDSTWGFAPGAQTDWPLRFDAPVGCDLGTLADQPTNATAADETCGPDGSPADGSITVGQVMGVDFSKVVDYKIDGKPVTQVTTQLPAGSYDVTATPQGTDGLDGPSQWTLTIASGAAVCGDLKTLALTGSNEFGWIVLAIILLQLGVGALAIRAALNRRRGGQHRVG